MKLLKSLAFFLPGILVSAYPVLSFYVANSAELSVKFLSNLLPAVVIFSLVVSFLLLILTRSRAKASLLAFVLLFIFFTYGHVSRFFNDLLFLQLPNGVVLGPDKILLPLVFLAVGVVTVKILKSQGNFAQVILYLNFTLLALVAYLSVTVITLQRPLGRQELVQTKNVANEASSLDTPDIYHVVLDGYAREDVLRQVYSFDNHDFTDQLENLGFRVANRARSNYVQTYLSLPSTFNMNYLDSLAETYGKNPANEFAALDLMKNNKVSKILRERGYTTLNFATWWGGTDGGYPADMVFDQDKSFKLLGADIATSETNMVFLQTTLLSPLITEVWGQALRGKVLFALQKLPDIPYLSGKKFTLAHIITPHPPYMFNADGSPIPGYTVETADEGIDKRPLYLGQVSYISRQILPVLQSLINNSQTPPIIILQSDHGPASILGRREDWPKNYSPEAVFERTGILFAVYLPDGDYQEFGDTFTPVNTYRVIFNKYFGADFPLLPDKTYFTDYDALYDFRDVTEFGVEI